MDNLTKIPNEVKNDTLSRNMPSTQRHLDTCVSRFHCSPYPPPPSTPGITNSTVWQYYGAIVVMRLNAVFSVFIIIEAMRVARLSWIFSLVFQCVYSFIIIISETQTLNKLSFLKCNCSHCLCCADEGHG